MEGVLYKWTNYLSGECGARPLPRPPSLPTAPHRTPGPLSGGVGMRGPGSPPRRGPVRSRVGSPKAVLLYGHSPPVRALPFISRKATTSRDWGETRFGGGRRRLPLEGPLGASPILTLGSAPARPAVGLEGSEGMAAGTWNSRSHTHTHTKKSFSKQSPQGEHTFPFFVPVRHLRAKVSHGAPSRQFQSAKVGARFFGFSC